MSDRILVLILGLVAGLLVVSLAGLLVVAASGSAADKATPLQKPPDGAQIEAELTEGFLSRAVVESTAGAEMPVTITDGRVDIQPNGRLQFVAQIGTPLGPMTTRGAITLSVRDGLLAFRIVDVRLGQAPVKFLAAPFLPVIESRINEEANRQLSERTALAKIKLLGLTSDEQTLRFYLAAR